MQTLSWINIYPFPTDYFHLFVLLVISSDVRVCCAVLQEADHRQHSKTCCLWRLRISVDWSSCPRSSVNRQLFVPRLRTNAIQLVLKTWRPAAFLRAAQWIWPWSDRFVRYGRQMTWPIWKRSPECWVIKQYVCEINQPSVDTITHRLSHYGKGETSILAYKH